MPHTNPPATPAPLSEEERATLLRLAREAIECRLTRRPPPMPVSPASRAGRQIALTPRLLAYSGAFVTLNTRQGELRGCVGLPFPAQPLYAAVLEAAPSAAVEDPRFVSVTLDELPSLKIEISVLSPPVDIRELDVPSAAASGLTPRQIAAAIRPGTHGLLISSGPRRGLLLPQVATEYGWSAERFLTETCHKAGLAGDAWQHGAKIEVFTAEIIEEK
jgi:AmmeMemoRadiSam system protein A